MRAKVSFWARAILMSTLLVSSVPSTARADDELPDLEVTFRGLNGQREVVLVVRNIDKEWWADETKIVIETVSPGSANRQRLDVENLDENVDKPGKNSMTLIKYMLAADCDGHMIKAYVEPAKNWAGLLETKTANNTLKETQVCPSKGAPKPEPKPENKPGGGLLETGPRSGPIVATDSLVVTNKLPTDNVIAVHLRPGTHTLDFDPKETISVWNSKYYNTVPEVTPNPQPIGWTPVHEDRARTPLIVGWAQNEDNWTYPRFRAYQVLARFDLEKLDEVPVKLVSDAWITWDETPAEWTNEDGDREDKDGCATSLGRFKFETDFNSVRGLIETEYVNDIPAGGQGTNVLKQILDRQVAVKQHILGYVQYPEFLMYQPNFVFRPELNDGEADDNEACLSTISGIQLHITYTVLD